MYIVANRVPVAAAWREPFEERFRTRAGQIEKQPGFGRLQVLRPADAASPSVVLTTWQEKAPFEAWVGSEDFRLGPISFPCPRRPIRVTAASNSMTW
jgi:heme oxygenase (mycobilin-producing)